MAEANRFSATLRVRALLKGITGWTGPKLVRLIPGRLLRILIGIGGIALAVRLGLSAYH